jgi:hypothetical protein
VLEQHAEITIFDFAKDKLSGGFPHGRLKANSGPSALLCRERDSSTLGMRACRLTRTSRSSRRRLSRNWMISVLALFRALAVQLGMSYGRSRGRSSGLSGALARES